MKTLASIAGIGLCISLAIALAQNQTPPPESADVPGRALIPAGDFWMGRVHFFLPDAVGILERDRQDDFPSHRVYIDAFYLDKYDVTNEDYAKFLAAKGGKKPWHWTGGRIAKGEERFPVVNVSWADAHDYCEWDGKRLPTEAEWEKAARGGLDKNQFVWGNVFAPGAEGEAGGRGRGARSAAAKPPANFHSTGEVQVGKYPPNRYGLFDMAGNVWQWVEDWYERNYYGISPIRNPKGPETGMYKVFRGGGWSDEEERNLMPSNRNYTDPVERSLTISFRCAKSAAVASEK